MSQPVTGDQATRLEDLKARQIAGERMPCPRCGRDAMDDEPSHNALSRHADILVCSSCGMAEALLDAKQTPKPLKDWACFAHTNTPERPTAGELISRVMTEQIKYLIALYERWLDERGYEDFATYQDAAMRECPCLIELQPSPFLAVYQAKDGKVVIRFERDGDSAKVSAGIVR